MNSEHVFVGARGRDTMCALFLHREREKAHSCPGEEAGCHS